MNLLHLSARLLMWTLAVACVARWALVDGLDLGWVLAGVVFYVVWESLEPVEWDDVGSYRDRETR